MHTRGVTPAIDELERNGVAFSVHEYERGESLHDFGLEAADKLGFDADQVFKTLLVTADGNQAVAIVAGQRQVVTQGGRQGARRQAGRDV